jgi:hypothetical protein
VGGRGRVEVVGGRGRVEEVEGRRTETEGFIEGKEGALKKQNPEVIEKGAAA